MRRNGAVDILRVNPAAGAQRRLRAVTAGGEETPLALPRNQALFDGAVLRVAPEGPVESSLVRFGALAEASPRKHPASVRPISPGPWPRRSICTGPGPTGSPSR